MYVGDIVFDGKSCIVRNCDMVIYYSNFGYDFILYYFVDIGVFVVVDIMSGGYLFIYVYSDVVGVCVFDI